MQDLHCDHDDRDHDVRDHENVHVDKDWLLLLKAV